MKISFDDLSIYNIEKLHKDILEELKVINNTFSLNFEEVSSIDLNFVQMLISLKKYCESKNIALELININTRQVKQMIKTLNLNEFLGL